MNRLIQIAVVIAAVIFLLMDIPARAAEYPAAAQVYPDTQEQIEEEEYLGELALLAALVHAEAEGEDQIGKELVANVVFNRVDAQEFPGTITGVIYQEWQFSPVKDGRLAKSFLEVTEQDYLAVREALNHRRDRNILYFTAGGYSQYGTPLYRHGGHYFSGR